MSARSSLRQRLCPPTLRRWLMSGESNISPPPTHTPVCLSPLFSRVVPFGDTHGGHMVAGFWRLSSSLWLLVNCNSRRLESLNHCSFWIHQSTA